MISLVDLKGLYKSQKEELDAAIERVLESGWYVLGREVETFTKEFASFCQQKYCVGVANGTDAVELALRGVGVVAGDHVATVSHTAVATVAAIERLGAIPVLVDVERERQTMSPVSLAATLKNDREHRIKAIVPVHLYGQCADMPAIQALANAHGCKVVEDCAQAHGAKLAGTLAGLYGDAAAFSFYPTKNLGAFGDGGAVLTSNDKVAKQVGLLQQYGWEDRYISKIPGCNSRLDEMQAALLRVRLRRLSQENANRQHLAHVYESLLGNTCGLALPMVASESEPVYHLYVVRILGGRQQRDACVSFLRERGIGVAIHYPVPIHQQPAYAGRIVQSPDGLPNTESLAGEVISLPMHPLLREDDVHFVCATLKQFLTIN